jgi:hypothetical protein
MGEKSFLQELLDKRAAVEKIAERTGKDTTAALTEVDRQIRQCLTGKNLITGDGVTKSGRED